MGKTTVSVNLAYSLAKRGWRTLLVDTDPQGSVGLSLSEKARKCRGYFDAVNRGADAASLILSTRLPELKLLTAGRAHSFFDGRPAADDSVEALERVVGEIASKEFDIVLFDTPAGLTGSTGDVLRVCNHVIIPQQAEPLGVRSIPQILQAIQFLRARGTKLEVAGILLTMVQNDQRESADVVRELRTLLPARLMFETVVPRDVSFLKASAAGVPLGLLHRHPPAAAHVFDQLAAELEPRLHLRNEEDAHEFTRLLD